MSSMQNDRKKKRRPSTPPKPAEAGETDLSQEWERRMRDVFGEPKSHKKTAKATVDIKQQPLPTAPAEPKKTRQNADYGRIIDEFDLERAVIYSEILKPKFEEY